MSDELSLDSRAILNYLNELGYRGLTAEQLKEFIKDLKKLIKYEKTLGVEQNYQDSEQNNNKTNQVRKSRQQKCEHRSHIDNNRPKTPNSARSTERSSSKSKGLINRPSSSSANQSTSRKTNRSRSKSGSQKSATKIQRECTIERPESRMWIRPKIPANKPKTSDPVQLYQYYKSEWNRFKINTPGENSHSELRWKIRHQLMGDSDSRQGN